MFLASSSSSSFSLVIPSVIKRKLLLLPPHFQINHHPPFSFSFSFSFFFFFSSSSSTTTTTTSTSTHFRLGRVVVPLPKFTLGFIHSSYSSLSLFTSSSSFMSFSSTNTTTNTPPINTNDHLLLSNTMEALDIKESSSEINTTTTTTTTTTISNSNSHDDVEDKKQSKKNEKKPLILKTPKGTTDFGPDEMALRSMVLSTLTTLFQRHGAVTIDTPVFELTSILQGKYGDDAKLVYDLQDQGGERCSLRYDLTVPLARYLAMHHVTQLKRFHIGKVYRRDQPAMLKGRRREFYQCDFDIVGEHAAMVPEAELLLLFTDIFAAFPAIGDVVVKLNHKLLLDAVLEVAGVPPLLFRPVASAIDKLDKLSVKEVQDEMKEKGVSTESIHVIFEFIQLKGKRELVQHLRSHPVLASATSLGSALDDLDLLFEYLEVFNIENKVVLDLSLARGLDYYTGVIFEAVLVADESARSTSSDPKQATTTTHPTPVSGVGSIGAGGRYDTLVGHLQGPTKKGVVPHVPCVGLSVGVERLCALLQAAYVAAHRPLPRASPTLVYVIAVGTQSGLLKERMALCRGCWQAGIPASFMHKKQPKLQAQFAVCEREQIPYAVFLGDDEVRQGVVRVKDMRLKRGEKHGSGDDVAGVVVPRDRVVAELKVRLGMV